MMSEAWRGTKIIFFMDIPYERDQRGFNNHEFKWKSSLN